MLETYAEASSICHIVGALFLGSFARPSYPQIHTDPSHNSLEVQLSQKVDSPPLWFQAIDRFAWPIVALVALFVFRSPAALLLRAMGKEGTQLDFAGFAITIPKLESKIEDQTAKLDVQQGQIDLQTEQIRHLITFSMSWYIYEMLWQIDRAQKFGGEYLYRNDGSMYRNLRFLIDHGYMVEIYSEPAQLQDLCKIVKITKAGQDLINMRGSADNSSGSD